MEQKNIFEEIAGLLNKNKDFQGIPLEAKSRILETIKKSLPATTPIIVPMPMFILKENDLFIASAPILELAAQGDTEEEAVETLREMIDDYMNDPDTKKPEINTMREVHVDFASVRMNPQTIIGADSNTGLTTR